MEAFTIKDLNFAYPEQINQVLSNINITIQQGDFLVIAGESGSGKTTLLRHLKPSLSHHGQTSGRVYFNGKDIQKLSQKDEASRIGFVMQNPDNQIVSDKVWHELAFGLESLGENNQTIRLRVAEVATFFGIEDWFYKDVRTLSGGQKQKLNLASIMTLQPEVLILDEPTSQLDPIATSEFLDLLVKINRDLGTTIIMVEHRLDEVLPLCNRVAILDKGHLLIEDNPQEVAKFLYKENHPFFMSMPLTLKAGLNISNKTPLSIKEGRTWLSDTLNTESINFKPSQNNLKEKSKYIEIKDAFFRYEEDYILKDVSFDVYKGEILTLLGGNGVGKSTMLSLLSSINRKQHGKILMDGLEIDSIKDSIKYGGLIGYMPQNPATMFVKKTLLEKTQMQSMKSLYFVK